jgi:uncharacterized membrane protein YeaQ/YmgE (transglycosylase-associated protein family)
MVAAAVQGNAVRQGIRALTRRRDMGLFGWIILGLAAGLLARVIHRGPEPGGALGAIAGGLIASAVGLGGIGSFFSLGTWLTAVGGALLILFVYGALTASPDAAEPRA